MTEKIAIDHKKLVFDNNNKKDFLVYLKKQEDKMQGLLLWSSIIVMVSYLAVTINMVRFYTSLDAANTRYPLYTMAFMFVLFAAYMWLQFKAGTYKPTHTALVIKELLNFKVYTANRQIKLLAAYIIGYSVIVAGICFLSW